MSLYIKKIAVIVSSAAILVLFLNYDKVLPAIQIRIMSVKILSEEELSEMINDKEKLETDASLMQYNNVPVTYDNTTNTVYIPQCLTKNEWEGALSVTEGRIYIADDPYLKRKGDAIEEGYLFLLFWIKGNSYSTCNLVFTGMPVMNLFTSGSTVAEGVQINEGMVQVYDQYRTSTRFQSAECTYRIRGNSSRNYAKPNYKLELKDVKLSFLGMRKDEDWILNSLYDDAGLVHNKVSYQVWREIAGYNQVKDDEGTTIEYVEVFIDNQYRGVYALTERIDRKELSLGRNDILYKCHADRIPEEHNYSNEDTDGMRPIFILKYPQAYRDEDWNPLKTWVNYFLKYELPDYQTGTALLDMENAIDYNLYCLLIDGSDNMRKNVFFVAKYQNDGSYRFIKVPWDLNATWGNPWVDYVEWNFPFPAYDPEIYKDVITWSTDISTLYYYNEIEISSLLYERWEELRQAGVITKEKIYQILDEQFAYLHASGAYKRNYERWPEGKEYWQDEYFYEYVEKRIDFLDQYFEQLYLGNITAALYDGIDYSNEFEARYYWETNYDILSELYSYDRQVLLEHYVYYGKPFEMEARKPN